MKRTIRIFETCNYERGLDLAQKLVESEADFEYTLLDCQGLNHGQTWTKICTTPGNLLLLNPALQQYATSEKMSYTEVNRLFNSLFILADQVCAEVDITPGATDFDTQEQADLWSEFVSSELFIFRHIAGYVDFTQDA